MHTEENTKMGNTKMLIEAAEKGNAKEVRRLIPLSDPKGYQSYALRIAARNGHAECVKLLIPVSDPYAENSDALFFAAEFGHTECLDLLYPVSDPHTALHDLQYYYPHKRTVWEMLEQRISNEQRNKLNSEITGTGNAKIARKM